MTIDLQNDLLVLNGKQQSITEVLEKLTTLSARQIADFFNRREIKLPRKLNMLALRSVLNKKIIIAKKLNLTDEMKYRLLCYPSFSEYQLQNFMSIICDKDLFIEYLKNLWTLVLLNGDVFKFADGEINYLLLLPNETVDYSNFMGYELELTPAFLDEASEFDGLTKEMFRTTLSKSSTLVELREIGAKYNLNIPRRLKKDELQKIIAEELQGMGKFDEAVQRKLNMMSVLTLQRFAKQNGIKVSIELKKEELIEYILKQADKSQMPKTSYPAKVLELPDEKEFTFEENYIVDDISNEETMNEVDESVAKNQDLVNIPQSVVVEEPVEQPVEETAEEAVEEATEEPVEEATEEPVKEATEEPVKEATEEPVEEATEEPVEEATEEPVKEATEEPVEEATEEPVEEAIEEPVEEATEEPVEEATEEPVEEATEEPVEEATEEPVEEATEEPVLETECIKNKENIQYVVSKDSITKEDLDSAITRVIETLNSKDKDNQDSNCGQQILTKQDISEIVNEAVLKVNEKIGFITTTGVVSDSNQISKDELQVIINDAISKVSNTEKTELNNSKNGDDLTVQEDKKYSDFDEDRIESNLPDFKNRKYDEIVSNDLNSNDTKDIEGIRFIEEDKEFKPTINNPVVTEEEKVVETKPEKELSNKEKIKLYKENIMNLKNGTLDVKENQEFVTKFQLNLLMDDMKSRRRAHRVKRFFRWFFGIIILLILVVLILQQVDENSSICTWLKTNVKYVYNPINKLKVWIDKLIN